jgi:hypothetical protein
MWDYSWLNFSMHSWFLLFLISVGMSRYIIYLLLLLCYYCTGYVVFVSLYKYSWCCCSEINTLWSLWCRNILYCRQCSNFCFSRGHIPVYIDLFTRSLHSTLRNYCLFNVATLWNQSRTFTVVTGQKYKLFAMGEWKVFGQCLSLKMLASSRERRWEHLV